MIPVAVFLTETVALGTAEPDASVTVPESVAPETCAYTATPPSKLKSSVIAIAKQEANFLDSHTPMRHLPDNHFWIIMCIVNLEHKPNNLQVPSNLGALHSQCESKSSIFLIIRDSIPADPAWSEADLETVHQQLARPGPHGPASGPSLRRRGGSGSGFKISAHSASVSASSQTPALIQFLSIFSNCSARCFSGNAT